MNSKGHLFISLVKSSARLIGTVGCIIKIKLGYPLQSCIVVMAALLAGSEVLGILEELVDKRG